MTGVLAVVVMLYSLWYKGSLRKCRVGLVGLVALKRRIVMGLLDRRKSNHMGRRAWKNMLVPYCSVLHMLMLVIRKLMWVLEAMRRAARQNLRRVLADVLNLIHNSWALVRHRRWLCERMRRNELLLNGLLRVRG